ncbi:hypothetical protein C8J57DRAFT_1468139 [Mycena rebaudengoi]|nr:hypothetical protein C8J57DRAFT_1468139 [Mycena rebaudengoi]
MFSKLIPFALCAVAVVRAFPSRMSCQTNVEAAEAQVDFSIKSFKPFKLINMGVNGSAFLSEENVLTQIGDTQHGDNGWWKRLVVRGVEATEFVVESASDSIPGSSIKMPYVDQVWEAVYDGSSMKFSYVSLPKTPGPKYNPELQHWTFRVDEELSGAY